MTSHFNPLTLAVLKVVVVVPVAVPVAILRGVDLPPGPTLGHLQVDEHRSVARRPRHPIPTPLEMGKHQLGIQPPEHPIPTLTAARLLHGTLRQEHPTRMRRTVARHRHGVPIRERQIRMRQVPMLVRRRGQDGEARRLVVRPGVNQQPNLDGVVLQLHALRILGSHGTAQVHRPQLPLLHLVSIQHRRLPLEHQRQLPCTLLTARRPLLLLLLVDTRRSKALVLTLWMRTGCSTQQSSNTTAVSRSNSLALNPRSISGANTRAVVAGSWPESKRQLGTSKPLPCSLSLANSAVW